MARVIPFKGLRYNQQEAGSIDQLVTPPYDIISPEEQQGYYQKNPYNCIRLELGEKSDSDSSSDNRYTRSKQCLDEWIAKGVLQADENPALYLYQQVFSSGKETKTRTGFLCGLKLEEYDKKVVLPHETTLPKDTADRLDLMKACHSNFSPIFGLYSDKERVVDTALAQAAAKNDPDYDFEDENHVIQRLWKIDDPAVISAVQQAMADKQVLIADGHHRYETALNFNKYMLEQGQSGYDYIMISLVNLYDPGLVIYPTHRLIKMPDIDIDRLLYKLKDYFILELYDDKKSIIPSYILHMSERKDVPCYCMATQDRIYVITIDKWSDYLDLLPQDKPENWRNLDVTILHKVVLEHILGISEEEVAKNQIVKYTRDTKYFFRAFKNKEFDLGFFMNAPKLQDVIDIANAGEKMPQKSTYFYPKLTTGLVFNYFDVD